MMRNKNGVTLITLAITIVVLGIIIGIGVQTSNTAIQEAKDETWNAELGIVRQAVVEQYQQASAVQETEKEVTEPSVSFWIGERITDFSRISLPPQGTISRNDEVDAFYQKTENYTYQYQEDCYYRLTPANLKEMDIQDAEHTYIVNYRTGEVYDETKQVNSVSELLYLSPIMNENAEHTGDTKSFNDWE